MFSTCPGEESRKQLAGRKKRLGLKSAFSVLATGRLDDILDAVREGSYRLVIIDSIQSISNSKLAFLPGSASQIRDVSSRLIRELKEREITHILVGHVTKEGNIAGPKILEHMVDTVLYFEGDRMMPYRMIRAIKNRYGPVDEIGLFQMRKEGLVSVEPSLFFLSERGRAGSGSTLFPHVTGSRPPTSSRSRPYVRRRASPSPRSCRSGTTSTGCSCSWLCWRRPWACPFRPRRVCERHGRD